MTTILLLAAGASTRMGQSKQLMIVEGEPLLVRSVRAALATGAAVTVVLGAHEEPHRNLLAGFPVRLVYHSQWKSGMGSSLKAGLRMILTGSPDVTEVVVMLCDQPMVSDSHLNVLVDKASLSEKEIIASSYQQTLGVPALFKRSLFSELLSIPDEAGAAGLIRSHPEKVEAVNFPEGAVDLDTPEDLARFRQQQGRQ